MVQHSLLAGAIAEAASPLSGERADLDAVMALVGEAPYVLIGEATHGTREFYRVRAELTQRLIVEKGFSAIAAEADWPDAYRVNRWVRGGEHDASAAQALADFKRFPAWMWRNIEVVAFVHWLRGHNERTRGRSPAVGFYGLDLYSLHASMRSVLDYLDRADAELARRARERYACFGHVDEDPQRYGYAAALGLTSDCEQEVVQQLLELQDHRFALVRHDGFVADDEFFFAEQNARIVMNAEEYYRGMFGGAVASWNLRDTHMAETLEALTLHLGKRVPEAKVVVWAHNSHVGDARATQMGDIGELNIGQLMRQRQPDSVLVGFSTYTGTVTAATDWGGPAERRRVRQGLAGSYEELLHHTGVPAFVLPLRDLGEVAGGLAEPRLQRAIGVVYRPESERASHYFQARLPEQFDAMIHIDTTNALEPLERSTGWERGEAPETYPSGL